jgi:SAM-dependent methyltransferase
VSVYGSDFYSQQVDGSVRSAGIVLPLLYAAFKPRSVLDVGCGRGGWLAVAKRLGSTRLKGIDGHWVNPADLLDGSIEFEATDLAAEVTVNERFDLSMSVEVAEHVPETMADSFVATLCRASDVVLFSAAIRFQGGTHHVNEQWQTYWIDRFGARGYDFFDVLRPAIWENEAVEWWYRQNLFVFVKRDSDVAIDRDALRSMQRPIPNIVHPVNYSQKAKSIQQPTLRSFGALVRNYVRTSLWARKP